MPTEKPAEPEIYPMPSFPTLVVSDIEASVNWYCEGLGFSHIFSMPSPDGTPSMAHLRWIKYADLLIFADTSNRLENQVKGVGVGLNYTATNIAELAQRAKQYKAQIVEGPVNRPWNICELVLLDPDGYRLVFNGPLINEQPRDFDAIVAGAAEGFKD